VASSVDTHGQECMMMLSQLNQPQLVILTQSCDNELTKDPDTKAWLLRSNSSITLLALSHNDVSQTPTYGGNPPLMNNQLVKLIQKLFKLSNALYKV